MVPSIAWIFHIFSASNCSETVFFGLVPWYHYLTLQPDSQGVCMVVTNITTQGVGNVVLLVMLAVVEDLLRIVGLLSVIYVVFAGLKFILSQGDPGETAKARGTIINALAGMGISVIAIAFVSFIGNQVGAGGSGSPGTGHLNLSALPNPTGTDTGATVTTILSIVFGIIGAIAFLMIVIGGFQYVMSQGDPQAATKAKNTILYALIGLTIAIVAQSIVSFALSKLG